MNWKIQSVREYCDDYRESKKQIKKYIYRVSCTDREYLKRKIVLMNESVQINCISNVLTKK